MAGVAALGYGIGDFLGGSATRRTHVLATVFWSHLAGFLLLALWSPFDTGRPTWRDLLAGGAAGLFGLFGLVALYLGLSRGRAAVVAPAAAVIGAMVPVAVGLAGGEVLSPAAWVGVGMALPAIFLVSSVGDMGRRAAGLSHGIVAGIGFGGYFVALAEAGSTAGLWPVLAARGLTTVLLGGVGLAVRRVWLRVEGGKTVGILIVVGALDLVGNVGFLTSSRMTSLAIAGVVTSLSPAVTVAMARLVHQEPLRLVQLFGVVLAVVAGAAFAIT